MLDRPSHPPVPLRQYALLADGERGALVGPRGDIAFLCAPQWHDDAVFSACSAAPAAYAVTPPDARYVWGGHYEQDTLIWRSRWVADAGDHRVPRGAGVPGRPGPRSCCCAGSRRRAATRHVRVVLECRGGVRRPSR